MAIIQLHFVAILFALSLHAVVSHAAFYRVPLNRTTVAWSLEFQSHNHEVTPGIVLQDGSHAEISPIHTEAGRRSTVSSLAGRRYRDSYARLARRSPYIYYYILYTSEVALGTPPQLFRAQVDIGWGDVFVPSWNCTYDSYEAQLCLPHNMYNSSQSSTYTADLSPASVHYMGVYTWGNISQDLLHVGGMRITDQVFEEATMWRPVPLFWDELFDTALGLARFPVNYPESTIKARNPFQNMVIQELLDRNLFSLKLARRDKEQGELIFGLVDHNSYSGELLQFSATNRTCGDNEAIAFYSSSGWQVPINSMSLGSTHSSGPLHISLPNHTAILSTDLPHIELSRGLAIQLSEHCGGTHELEALSCENRTLLPNLTIALGSDGLEITLTPWDYLVEVEDESLGTRCILPFATLMEGLDGLDYVILGTAFLSGLYSVFDYDNQTVSFAKAKTEQQE